MDYNTQRPKLVIPEYGRIIQRMVDYCCTLPTRDERTRAAKTIVTIMGNMNPPLRDIDDFRHKLWDSLAIMSNFKLDIDWPYPLPDKQIFTHKPDKLPYSDSVITYRHYGRHIEEILSKIGDYNDEPEKQQALLKLMANRMKRSYMAWKEEHISDDIIFKELYILTKGAVPIPQDMKLENYNDALAQPAQPSKGGKAKRKKSQPPQKKKY